MISLFKNSLTRLAGVFLLCCTLSSQAAERVTYYHNDALGSVVAASDENGNLSWSEEYGPFGARQLQEASDGNDIWYTGKQEEGDLGVQYFHARWYDPGLGAFLSRDPAGFSQRNVHSFNFYVYASANPYRYLDPDGREIVSANPENNKKLAGLINSLASGRFSFDKNNRLVMDAESGGEGKSDFYTKQLAFAIQHEGTITIDIIDSEDVTSRDIKTTSRGSSIDSEVTITERTITLDGFGGVVPGRPDTNLAHELVEHAIPNLTHSDKGNLRPTFSENIIRRDNGLPRRSGRDH